MNAYPNVIKKPWGWEYCMWESPECSLWFLNIDEDQQTSMHCHPSKTTGLVLLKGEAEFCFLADTIAAKAPEKRMIRRGLFHRERAVNGPAWFLEVETPNNKRDLIRLEDVYGRAGKGYEDETTAINDKYRIRITEPPDGLAKQWIMDGCQFIVERPANIAAMLNGKQPDDIIVFLRGGLLKTVDGEMARATVPGDVGRVKVIKYVADQMEKLQEDTLILTVPFYK